MGITLANFQLKAIEALMEAMGEPNRDIILKSCTSIFRGVAFGEIRRLRLFLRSDKKYLRNFSKTPPQTAPLIQSK